MTTGRINQVDIVPPSEEQPRHIALTIPRWFAKQFCNWMPKAAARHDPQRELPHELPAASQNSQEASSTITAGVEHSLPLHFKNPKVTVYQITRTHDWSAKGTLIKRPCAAPDSTTSTRVTISEHRAPPGDRATETTTSYPRDWTPTYLYPFSPNSPVTKFVAGGGPETWKKRLATTGSEGHGHNPCILEARRAPKYWIVPVLQKKNPAFKHDCGWTLSEDLTHSVSCSFVRNKKRFFWNNKIFWKRRYYFSISKNFYIYKYLWLFKSCLWLCHIII